MNEFLNKNKIKLVILAISAVVLLTSASYAYFTATVSGNQANSNVVTSGVMEVTFEDGQLIGTPTDMIPGQSITKSFTVTNTGTVPTSYTIYFSEVINTFNPATDLEYKLEKTSLNGFEKEYTTCPITVGEINSEPISIEPGETQSYILTITFKETNTNQDSNKDKMFKSKLQINEYRDSTETISGIITDEGGNPIANQAMVAYSNPVYFTTDENGHYEVTLPIGLHNIYFIPGLSEQNLKNLGENVKTSSNVKTAAVDTHITDNITINNYRVTKNITIHPENGSANYTVEKGLGLSLGALEEPINGDYIFIGWYSDSNLTNPVNSNSIVTKNLNDIYAKYQTTTEITIHPENGGANYTVEKGIGLSLGALEEPVKSGYSFVGWYRNSNLTSSVNSNTVVTTSLTDLYAKYNFNPTISEDAENTLDSKCYNGDTNNSGTIPRSYVYLKLPSGASGHKLNLVVHLTRPSGTTAQCSHIAFGFYNSTGSFINGYAIILTNSTLALTTQSDGDYYSDRYKVIKRQVGNTNKETEVLETTTVTIPSNAAKVGFRNFGCNYEGYIHNIYLTE